MNGGYEPCRAKSPDSPFKCWSYWAELADSQPEFIIPGLLHSRATMLTGKPFAGKTTMAASIAAAVASQGSLADRTVSQAGDVLVITTDPAEERAWGRRMRAHKTPLGVVRIAGLKGRSTESLDDLVDWAIKEPPAVLVVDNMLGVRAGDNNDTTTANAVLSVLDKAVGAGISVLAVHHSSAKSFEAGRGSTKTPLGTTAWAAWPRLTLNIRVEGDRLTVETESNVSQPETLTLRPNRTRAGAVHYEVIEAQQGVKRDRSEETRERNRRFAEEEIVGNPALAKARTQRDVAEALQVSQTKVQRSLKQFPAHHVPGVGWVAGPREGT